MYKSFSRSLTAFPVLYYQILKFNFNKRFVCVPTLRHFHKCRGSLATHAPLRVRQALGRVPAPVPFRGRRCPACGFWSHPLTGPARSGFRDLLSEEECAAASRFHTPELAERYRQAHGWMRSVLSRYLDTPPETLRFRSGPDGKPRLAHGSLYFNLAHSDSLALLAVRQDAPVGVDVEPVRPLPEAMLIACRWFSAPEIRWIAASDDRDRAFLRCWVCREAFLKATGEGLGRPLDSFALHPCGDTLRLDGAALAECTPLAGHVAAVVCETLFPSC